jgi:hypothetical protein
MGTLEHVVAWRVPPVSCSVGMGRSYGTAGSHGQVRLSALVHTVIYFHGAIWGVEWWCSDTVEGAIQFIYSILICLKSF